MAVNHITLKLAACSDAAGKHDPSAPLDGNEDNFYINEDLSVENSELGRLDKPVELSSKGCLMAVADGMGGQNAGEVASEIAVETVAAMFKPSCLTAEITKTAASRAEYIKQVIAEADRRVKADAEANIERHGMGSTLIISWIYGSELTVGWIGDSRAYLFNAASGLRPLSHDHTYVQELADQGIITYEDTFSHPQGNIVTRSLGDPSQEPVADAVTVELHRGDVLLMCSDGLSGVIPDQPMRGITDSLETILREGTDDLNATRDRLMKAAERNDWYDNVTVLLCSVDGKGLPAMPGRNTASGSFKPQLTLGRLGLIVLVAALVVGAIFLAINALSDSDDPKFTASPEDTQAQTQIAETIEPDVTDEEFFTPEAVESESTTEGQDKLKESETTSSTDPNATRIATELVTRTQNWRSDCIEGFNSLNGPAEWENVISTKTREISLVEDNEEHFNFYNDMLKKFREAVRIYNELLELAKNDDLPDDIKGSINKLLNSLKNEISGLRMVDINKGYSNIKNQIAAFQAEP